MPVPDLDTAAYFDGLRQHRLVLLRCADPACRRWIHAPLAACPACHGRVVEPEEASGRGTVYTYTVVHREFTPGVPPPYVAALVELVEQRGLRILTDIVDCRADDVHIGMAVEARYQDYDTHTLVYFAPVEGADNSPGR